MVGMATRETCFYQAGRQVSPSNQQNVMKIAHSVTNEFMSFQLRNVSRAGSVSPFAGEF